jgi:hypothetical protein
MNYSGNKVGKTNNTSRYVGLQLNATGESDIINFLGRLQYFLKLALDTQTD